MILNGAATSIASFHDARHHHTLISNSRPPPASGRHRHVTITKVNEVVTITRAELRTRNGQLRVEGSTNLFSMPNVISIYASDGIAGTHRTNAIGTITADPLPVTFAFRVNSGVTLPAGVTRLDIYTSRGGVLENVAVSIRT